MKRAALVSILSWLALGSAAPAVRVAQQANAVQLADSARREIELGNIVGDLDRLAQANALVERALARFPDDPLLLHYRGYALYREATLRSGRDGEDVGPLLDEAERVLSRSAELDPRPETYALWSSVLGQKIGDSPIRGMTLGPRSGQLMERALEQGPENPRVWLMRGMSAIYTPAFFGGGLERAEQYLRRAIELYRGDRPAPPAPSWGQSEVWAWLGQVLHRSGRTAEARQAYLEALRIEPEYAWVRYELLPALERPGRV